MPAVCAFLVAALGVLGLPELPDAARLWPAALLLALWPLGRFRWVAAGAAGALLAWGAAQRALADDWSCRRDREVATVTGRVAGPPLRRAVVTQFPFDTRGESQSVPVPAHVLVSWYDEPPALAAGERWTLELRLRCRHGWRNPGGFDREFDLLARGFGATASVTRGGGRRLDRAAAYPVERLRERIVARIDAAVATPRAAALLAGLAVGVRAEIPGETWRAFVATGTVHLLAISGTHVTAFAALLVGATGLVFRAPLPGAVRRRRVVLTAATAALGTIGYALLAGASVPTLRTTAGVALLLLLGLMRRAVAPLTWLAVTGVALAAFAPLALIQPGFWLSFLAVAALLSMSPAAAAVDGRLGGFLRAQAAVTIALAVPLALFFGGVSWSAPLANLIAVPFFGLLLLPVVLAGAALSLLGSALDAPLYRFAAWLVEAFVPLLEWLAASGGGLRYLAASPWPALAVAALLCAVVLAVPLRTGYGLVAFALLGLVLAEDRRVAPGGVELVVYDVGQGLAAAVLTANHALLYDTGPAFFGDGSAAATTLVPSLARRGVVRLDGLIVSHPDSDHAGGTAAVRRAFAPRWVLAGGQPRPPGARACVRGQRWRWDGVEFELVHPAAGAALDDNDGSCVLAVKTPGGRVLLTADIGPRVEAVLAAADVRADVVLVPHHGSRRSSTETFVARGDARLALASAGFGNRWGMPADRVVAAWTAAGAKLLRTDRDGAITVTVGPAPGAIALRRERFAARRWWQAEWPP